MAQIEKAVKNTEYIHFKARCQKVKNPKSIAGLIQEADCVLIGAGAGLSASAGLTYGGKRFTVKKKIISS